MKSRLSIEYNSTIDVVEVRYNGSLIKSYPALRVMHEYGMEEIMNDFRNFCNDQGIDPGKEVEFVLIRR